MIRGCPAASSIRRPPLAGAIAAVFIAFVAAPGYSGEGQCDVPAELLRVEVALPNLSERLRAGIPVKIVAIGGASTTGVAAGSPDLAYPHRLQEALDRWYPAVQIIVVNKGVPRQTAQQMLERIDIILVDMQFSRSTVTVIDFERYLHTLHQIGEVNELYVFPRFEMMRYWSEQNVFNFDGVAKNERASLAARVYECIGRKLAEAIRLALQ